MNYKETLSYLYSRLPMFQRVGAAAYKANLDNTWSICELLQNPQSSFPCIHIAGTNGKGSTSHMLASIFQAAGYKTGLYTSPHLKDFRERIKVNGRMISQSYVVRFVEKYQHDFEKIEPSFFEWTVGLAFDYFRSQKVDIAIIETGLGGRLDSTNVVQPLFSIITNIGYDHMQFLGNTLQKIAKEKAGIIKPETAAIIGETQTEVKKVFEKRAKDTSSFLSFADAHVSIQQFKRVGNFASMKVRSEVFTGLLKCDLPGFYQKKNISTVLHAISFARIAGYKINKSHIQRGISKVKFQTGLRGRWETILKSPLIIADTAHNSEGVKELVKNLKLENYKNLHFVIGMVGDKDVTKVLKLLPKNAVYYFTEPQLPRKMPVQQLQLLATKNGLQGKTYKSVKLAIKAAKQSAFKRDLIVVSGSTFVVAEALQ